MTTATKGIETTNVDIDEASPNNVVPSYSKLMNKFMRAGSIISMCISAILAKASMPIGIARLA